MLRLVIVVSLMLSTIEITRAALAPQYQNLKDLEVLVEYIKANPDVAGSLLFIDLESYKVILDDGCNIIFKREEIKHDGVAPTGPATDLQFDRIECR